MTEYYDLKMDAQFRNLRHVQAEEGLAQLAKTFGLKTTGLTPLYKRLLKDYLVSVGQAMVEKHSSPYPNRAGENLMVRSGEGMKSRTLPENIKIDVKRSGKKITGKGELHGKFYLRTQEGMHIKAKKANYLTIPLPAAMDKKGLPLKKSASEWPNTFVTKTKNGNLIIAQRKSKKEITALYLLRKSVYIPPRLRLKESFQDTSRYFTDTVMDALYHHIMNLGWDKSPTLAESKSLPMNIV